jgi:antirestriction protein
MRIYVACLASYNAGILHGRWIDASADVDAMQGEIDAMLRASPCPNGFAVHPDTAEIVPSAEEYAVHDYDGVPSDLGEYPGLEKIAAFVALCDDFDFLDSDDIAAIAANWCGDLDQARDALQDDFCGIYPAFRDYADEVADEMIACYVSDAKIPQALINYFDYESHARDLAFSMTVINVSTGVAVFLHS